MRASAAIKCRNSAKISGAKLVTLNIEGGAFHPEWNYTISPKTEV